MKTRDQIYKNEFNSILRDLSVYRCLTKDQILRLTPGKGSVIENLLTYMEYHCRLWRDGEYYYSTPDGWEKPARSLTAAIWVLLDVFDKVEYHSTGEDLAQIIFFADEIAYEIVYAERGKEAHINERLNEERMKDSAVVLIVESPEQISQINAPNIKAYCSVSESGEVHYYQKE